MCKGIKGRREAGNASFQTKSEEGSFNQSYSSRLVTKCTAALDYDLLAVVSDSFVKGLESCLIHYWLYWRNPAQAEITRGLCASLKIAHFPR